MVDAIVVKAKESGRIRSKAILIAIGFYDKEQREILGMMVGDSESMESWKKFFTCLESGNPRDVDVVSDSHLMLVKAVKTLLQGCTQGRCQVHFIRHLLATAPEKLH